jgi:DNA-binding MarR family transcriptional regulator
MVDDVNYMEDNKMNQIISDIYDSLQKIAWHFGAHGINGECCGDLSFVEYTALKKASEKNELSVQEIGNALNFTKSGATRIIDRLENKGYAVREHSPTDGRVCCIAITDKGKEAIKGISQTYKTYLEDALKEMSPEKINEIKGVLEILLKAVQQKEAI